MRFSIAVVLTYVAAASAALNWTLQKAGNPTTDQADAYKRIESAMTLAVARYARFTSASKNIKVYYSPGVPTAEASYNGDLRFGSDRSYMTERTAMHEISHTLGVGQSFGGWSQGRWTSPLNVNTVIPYTSRDTARRSLNAYIEGLRIAAHTRASNIVHSFLWRFNASLRARSEALELSGGIENLRPPLKTTPFVGGGKGALETVRGASPVG
ncbi:hypothetical protein NUW58_g9954 [Xylaria curta]|uniref:Uncharacterized protein n=1 Tax=Xylaria curta TaxID=42375 RepID=A0ACC1MRD0_9PEZI|nr:hypothetical protein NUW58_g9954 [Xylaria curta]